jgi:hypothetical protein
MDEYVDKAVSDYLSDIEGNCEKIVEPYLETHSDFVIVDEGDIYREMVIYGFRNKTEAELAREKAQRRRERERNAKRKAAQEASERKLYNKLKAKYED